MSDTDPVSPNYLYKLIPQNSTLLDPMPEVLPLSELDEESGFIHLSTAPQVEGTLRHFFASEESVHILKIPFEPVKDKIQWESPDKQGMTVKYSTSSIVTTVCGPRPAEGLFPHLYSGKLGKEEVEYVVTLNRASTRWEVAIKDAKLDWLVY